MSSIDYILTCRRSITYEVWLRIHQEDLCQALGVHPSNKYQNDGGPGPREIAELLRSYSSAPNDDVITLADALALNWLIAGTDAHAKNYGILIAAGRVRLAPLYDIASVLPYPRFDVNRIKLAMKVGDRYRMSEIRRGDWQRTADQLQLDPDSLLARIRHMAEAIPDLSVEISAELKHTGLAEPILDRLVKRLGARAFVFETDWTLRRAIPLQTKAIAARVARDLRQAACSATHVNDSTP